MIADFVGILILAGLYAHAPWGILGLIATIILSKLNALIVLIRVL
jgi:hypothetical protein